MKKALTKQEMETLGMWFDEHIEETEAEWEAARRSGSISTVGKLGCSSLADASNIGKKSNGSTSGRASARVTVPLVAKSR